MQRVKVLILSILTFFLITISSGYISVVKLDKLEYSKLRDDIKTEAFIKELNIYRYEHNGSDFGNQKYSPLRIGKSLKNIDITYDYDFVRLAKTEESLLGVNRRKALAHIFDTITNGAKNNKEKHLRILSFLQKSSFHNLIQPIYPDKSSVFDPLVLLELSEMRCGQVSRVAIDLFASAGIRGRLIQAKNHVLAEIFYDNSWHFFDADLLGGDKMIYDSQGNIPSFVELSHNPYLADTIPNNYESIVSLPSRGHTSYPYTSYFYFDYDLSLSLYYNKIANEEEEQNKFYGWNFYQPVVDKRRKIGHIKEFYVPGSVDFKEIWISADTDGKNILNLEWFAAQDIDNDLLGYKVYVSKQTRGWNYARDNSSKKLKRFYNNDHLNWKPQMLELLYQEPPHEIAFVKTPQENISITLNESGNYYVTIMPYDAHGESVGRVIYTPSQELKIQV
ncbi:hypothetical protein [Pseudanabaena sp. ABRG5-3]|uniref:hypothetical protein n=1 Tax=Pseudanabaena sp. ABRG5-3 TaxID=685565 RepID=UPI000DC6D91A|nr:hypothetical protein [Pseudanabaena sp. ABRG5-3]BBC22739.1 hypothetical protein ABRG53_0482 [Pseudanabaena sp. ABRG5-3]